MLHGVFTVVHRCLRAGSTLLCSESGRVMSLRGGNHISEYKGENVGDCNHTKSQRPQWSYC